MSVVNAEIPNFNWGEIQLGCQGRVSERLYYYKFTFRGLPDLTITESAGRRILSGNPSLVCVSIKPASSRPLRDFAIVLADS